MNINQYNLITLYLYVLGCKMDIRIKEKDSEGISFIVSGSNIPESKIKLFYSDGLSDE